MSDIKNYSFNLDKEKHKDLIEWIEKQRKENDINFSSLIRRLLDEERKRDESRGVDREEDK